MKPTTMASAMENNVRSCHLRGAVCLARSEKDIIATVRVDIMRDAHGTVLVWMDGWMDGWRSMTK